MMNHTKTLHCKTGHGSLLRLKVADLKTIKAHPETWEYMVKTAA